MSLMRAPVYAWSDGYRMHLWLREDTESYPSPAVDEIQSGAWPGFVGGVAIDEQDFDTIALFHVASLSRSPKRWRRAVKRARKQGSGNFGSHAFFEALGDDPAGELDRRLKIAAASTSQKETP